MRKLRFLLVLALAAPACGMAARAEEAPMVQLAALPEATPVALRGAATVAGHDIRLGDLFENAGTHADDVVAVAPAPGQSMLFDADWLAAIARRDGLDWQPPNSFVEIRVARAAHIVSKSELEQALLAKIVPGRNDAAIRFDTDIRLVAPADRAVELAVEDLDYDAGSGRFTASVHAVSDDPNLEPVRVGGTVDTMIRVPTLARSMQPGDTIAAEDIVWTSMRMDLLPQGDIMDPRELVGRTPRHPVRAAQPLRPGDVELPIVVKRNELVLVVLERPGLYLTVEGKAMEDGARGTVIRTVNTETGRAIDTVVLGSGRVAVVTPDMQAMN